MKKEKNISSIILIILAIGAIIALLLFLFRYNAKPLSFSTEVTEAEVLENSNQESIDKAKNNFIESVKAIDSTDNYWGKLESPVEMIVYNDFEDSFCSRFYETIKKTQAEFENKVVIAIRHNILPTHKNALGAAMASECAAEQGKFWEMFDQLFEDNKLGKLNNNEYINDASELGLNVNNFEVCLETEKYKDKIQTEIKEAEKFGVEGAPTIFINKEILPGAYPFEDFLGANGDENGIESIIKKYLYN